MSSDPGRAQHWTDCLWPSERELREMRYPTLKIFSKEEAMPARTREDLRSIVTETLVSVATNAQADPMARLRAAELLMVNAPELALSKAGNPA